MMRSPMSSLIVWCVIPASIDISMKPYDEYKVPCAFECGSNGNVVKLSGCVVSADELGVMIFALTCYEDERI